MIERVGIQNFKCLKGVEITFDERLTILVGPNGCGKSTVLKAVNAISGFTAQPKTAREVAVYVVDHLGGWYSGQQEEFQLAGAIENGNRVELDFKAHPKRNVRGNDFAPPSSYFILLYTLGDNRRFELLQRIPNQPDAFAETTSALIGLSASPLGTPTQTKTSPPILGTDGLGLASLIAYFKLYDESRFEQIEELYRCLIPQVRKIRIDRVKTDQGGAALGEGLLFDLVSRAGVPASSMSDGSLYALGLIVTLLNPQRPRVLLIDDLDHGFHPKAQMQLIELLRKLLAEMPDLQIIATSHSPFILDRLEYNEVRMMYLKEDGTSAVGKPQDHPDFDRWKDAMSPGEFWSTFYEDWIARQPQPAQ